MQPVRIAGEAAGSTMPVSYTHLDVYKRQVDAQAGDAEAGEVFPDFVGLSADMDDYALAAAFDEIHQLAEIGEEMCIRDSLYT